MTATFFEGKIEFLSTSDLSEVDTSLSCLYLGFRGAEFKNTGVEFKNTGVEFKPVYLNNFKKVNGGHNGKCS
jgi:hypothetical protein